MLTKGAYSYPLKEEYCPTTVICQTRKPRRCCKTRFSNTKRIVLAHLSLENNTKEIAFDTAVKALKNCGVTEGKDVSVYVADQFNNEVCF